METTFCGGFDPGKRQDPAAFALLECGIRENPFAHGITEPVYDVCYLYRWPIGTPYKQIIREITKFMFQPWLKGSPLAFDIGGVGEPLFEWFQEAMQESWLKPIRSTGGGGAKMQTDGIWNVAKSILGSTLVTVFASGRVGAGRVQGTDEGRVLMQQLAAFKEKITKNLEVSFDADRDETGHADVAMAVAMALWTAENTVITWDGSLGGEEAQESIMRTAAAGAFATDDLSAWHGRKTEKPRSFDANGRPIGDGTTPAWGPDW